MTSRCICFFLFLGFINFGCSSKKRQVSQIVESYRLIDSQRTDEAIYLLERELGKKPKDRKLTMALVSAYAHKAGIKIQSLTPSFLKIDLLQKIKFNFSTKDIEENNSKVNALALAISQFLIRIANVFELYKSIPVISKEGSSFLYYALSLIEEIDDKLKHEDLLYRAILRIVAFKYTFAENIYGELSPNENLKNCSIDLEKLNISIIEMGQLIIGVVSDLGFSRGVEIKKINELASKVADATSAFTIVTTTLLTVDQFIQLFYKQSLLQSKAAGLLKCPKQ